MRLTDIDRDGALSTLDRTAARFSELLRSVTDSSAPAVGHWSIGETAAHTAQAFALEIAVLRGEATPATTVDAVTDLNEEGLRKYKERDPQVIADRMDSLTRELIDAFGRCEWDELVAWHGGIKVSVSAIPSILVGECLVHGFDIAHADDKPWSIPRDDAVIALAGVSALAPYYVDSEATTDLEACFEIRLRGGPTLYVIFDRGTVTIEEQTDKRVDAHISADPAAYLLAGYKRTGQLAPALKGKIVVWGRKPWLTFRLAGAFKSP